MEWLVTFLDADNQNCILSFVNEIIPIKGIIKPKRYVLS